MRQAEWQRLSALFDELAELPPAERQARLASLPTEQAEQLSRMLAELPDDDPTVAASIFGFQRHLAGALSEPAVEAAKVGDRFGAWCLAELLGEGGMGQVWRAERADGLYQGEAAIKLLREDVAGTGLAQRFARERALLGRLAHPGIARLLDAGEKDGRAFLVLEYVAGKTLSEHVRGGRGLNERVALIVAVASAVEYAHAQLIVHRDLKPSNVMVDEQGQPKLLDFGIAGLLDDSGRQSDNALTQITGRRLTPAYAAPEQITGGVIGVAADIFSLGVMLHEIATGQLPFGRRGISRAELEHAVVHGQAKRISQSLEEHVESTASLEMGPGRPPDAKRAAGDLEAVIAKALRREPAERYASVGALIDDLQRWLTQRPVSVRREDWRHRMHLWARRNAPVAIGGSLVFATLSLGLAVSLWQRGQAQAAARQAEQVTGYFAELLGAASPDQNGGRQPTVVELLDHKRKELQGRFNDEPAVKDRVLETLVKTYFALQRFGEAADLAQQRLTLTREAFGEDDPRTEDAAFKLGTIYTAVAGGQTVIDLMAPLLPKWDRRYGPLSEKSHEMRLHLFTAYARLGHFADARRVLAEARRSNDALYASNALQHARLATYESVLLVYEGRLAEAARVLEDTRPFWNPEESDRKRPALVLERNYAFVLWRRAGESASAATVRSDDLIRRWDAMARPGNHASTLMRQQLAVYLQQLGDFDAALAQLSRAQADTEAAGADDAVTGTLRRIQLLEARVLAAGGANAAAVQSARQALSDLDASPLIGDVRRAEGLLVLGRVALAPGAGDAGQALARDIDTRLDALREVLAAAGNATSRVGLFKGRRAGTPQAWLAATRQRVAYFDSLPETQGLPEWTARLQHACALRAAGEPWEQALARAEQARPANLAALTDAPHPLARVAMQLPGGLPPDCDWRF